MKAVKKNTLREISKTKSRFLSILLICAIGVGFFSGVRATCKIMKTSADDYYDMSELFDLRALSTFGLTENDAKAIAEIDGVDGVYTSKYTDLALHIGEREFLTRVYSKTSDEVNKIDIFEGRAAQAEDECVMSYGFHHGGINIGDVVSLADISGADEFPLVRDEYKVVGFYNTPVYISKTQRGSTNIGDGALDAFMIVPAEHFTQDVFTEIYIRSNRLREMDSYSDEYEKLVGEISDRLEELGVERSVIRYDEVLGDVIRDIEQGEKDLAQARIDGQKELDDAKRELEDAAIEIADGEKELDDAKKELEDGKIKLDNAERELIDAKKEVDDGRAELEENRAKIEDAKRELEDAERELIDAKKELDDALKELEDGKKELEDAKREIEDGEQKLKDAEKELADSLKELDEAQIEINFKREEIERGREEINNAWSEISSAETQIDAQYAMLDAQERDLDLMAAAVGENDPAVIQGRAAIAAGRAQLDAARSSVSSGYSQIYTAEDKLNEGEKQLDEAQEKLNDGRKKYEEGVVEYNKSVLDLEKGKMDYLRGWAKYEDGVIKYNDGLEKYNDGYAKYEEGLAEYEDGLTEFNEGEQKFLDGERKYLDGVREFNEKKAEYEDGVRDYEQGLVDLADAKQKYADGLVEYADGVATFEREIADAEQELSDAREKISDAGKAEWYVFDRDDNPGYAEYESNAERINRISMVFPIFFLLVAGLVCLTTMSRMVEEQRTQIGTIKAMGYSNGAVMRHYMLYAVSGAVVGGTIGAFGGCVLFPGVITYAYSMMYNITDIHYLFEPGNMLFSIGSMVAAIAVTVALSCGKALKESPASLMRPKAPKAGKRVLIERIPLLWDHMGFFAKVSGRNIFRYKRRMFMTVVGIAGCTALSLTGLGLKNSISDIVDLQYNKIYQYSGYLAYDEDSKPSEVKSIEKTLLDYDPDTKYTNALIKQHTVSFDGNNVQCYVTCVEDAELFEQFIDLHERVSGEKLSLSGGVIITEKAAKLLGAAKGDSITVQVSDGVTADVVISGVTEHYTSHYLYMSEDAYSKAFNRSPKYNLIYFDNGISRDTDVQDAFCAKVLENDNVLGLIMNASSLSSINDTLKIMDLVTIVLIVSAAALAFVVLYNLTNVNITERIREIATLKVLGFYDMEVSNYIFRENIILSIMGGVVGLGLGQALCMFVVTTAEIDEMMFGRSIHLPSYFLALIITIAFSLIVNLIMTRVLKQISMVESLKSVE